MKPELLTQIQRAPTAQAQLHLLVDNELDYILESDMKAHLCRVRGPGGVEGSGEGETPYRAISAAAEAYLHAYEAVVYAAQVEETDRRCLLDTRSEMKP